MALYEIETEDHLGHRTVHRHQGDDEQSAVQAGVERTGLNPEEVIDVRVAGA